MKNKLKFFIKKLLPNFLILQIPKIKLFFYNNKFKNLNTEQRFNKIYKNNIWGKSEKFKYYSGIGSHKTEIIQTYIEKVREFIIEKKRPVVVDCGCGDFNIGKNFFEYCEKYYGLDIFEELITENKKKFNKENLFFLKKDITNDNLPKGDIIIIRQVLQHLTNEEIINFLKNINNNYKYLIVTEHIPRGKFKSNIDTNNFSGTRSVYNSGIILHEEPFNIKYKTFIPLNKVDATPDEGFIETVIYELNI